MNQLFFGDNLDVLRQHIKDDSVDLVYLDPPFKSNQDYNVLFRDQDGTRSAAQIKAFKDTWRWDHAAADAFQQVVEQGGKVSQVMQAFDTFLGKTDMLAYLSMMAPRLAELRRVLKPTGSIYLHCDPTASHYLKLLMDGVFGPANFANEISWKRTTTKGDYRQGATNWPRIRDVILYYGKDLREAGTFIQPFSPYTDKYTTTKYRYRDADGRVYRLDNLMAPGAGTRGHPQYEFMGVIRYWRYNREKMEALLADGRIIQTQPGTVPQYKRYLDEMPGIAIGDSWTDIDPINSQAIERLGYPTQKPSALLERIIRASSHEGDTVLDPFCGCGTAIAASQQLKRQWIGIDITYLAIALIKHRLFDSFGQQASYRIRGEPTCMPDAEALAAEDRFEFQCWALGLVGARPIEPHRGADQGIDGRLFFHDEGRQGRTKQVILSVKSGAVAVKDVRDLRGVIDREKAQIGVVITLRKPTGPMRTEAASAGFYTSPWGRHLRLQILTIAELFEAKGIDYPGWVNTTFRSAPRQQPREYENLEMPLERL